MDTDPRKIESLLAEIAVADFPRMRAIGEALTRIGTPALPMLVNRVVASRDNSLSYSLVEAIAAMEDSAAVSHALLDILAHGHGYARLYALSNLGGHDTDDPTEIVPQLISALRDAETRLMAVQALSRFRSRALEAAPRLLELLETTRARDHDSTLDLHAEIARALGGMGPEILPLLLPETGHDSASVRSAIAVALRNIGPDARDAEPQLLRMLADPVTEVRTAARGAIASVLPPARSVRILLHEIVGDAESAHHVFNVLAQVGHAAIPHLVIAMTSDALVAGHAFEALSSFGEEGVRGLLQLTSSDAPERGLARIALAQLLPQLDHISTERGDISYQDLTDDRLGELIRTVPGLLRTLHDEGEVFERRPQVMRFSGPTIDEQIATVRRMVKRRRAMLREVADALGKERKKEPDRFTDAVVYPGHFTSAEDLRGVAALADDVPFVPGQHYTLEVAIRRKRRGVSAKKAAPRATRNPRRDEEEVLIYVLARALWKGITIEEEFLTLTWPHDSDSRSALFRLTASADLPAPSQGAIEIRLYDGSLDLLDIVSMSCTVSTAGVTGIAPRELNWPDPDRAVVLADPNGPARFLSIHVRAINRTYQFDFLVRSAHGVVVRIPILRDIQDDDLKTLLIAVRNFWTRLVVTHYEQALSVTKTTFERDLGELRDLGMRAWTLLFGSRFADQSGAGEALGKLLAALEGKEGDCIQVTHADRFTSFVFPWSILYPPGDATTVDPLRFWGAKYQIEQVTGGSDRDTLSDEPVKMAFVLDPSFGNSADQTQLMRSLRTRMSGRLKVTQPISDEAGLVTELTRRSPAHLFYFFCHGYTASGPSGVRYDGVKLLKSEIEELPEDSAERRALSTLLALTAKMNDESWIYVGGGEIKESRLRQQSFFTKRRPLIFLNMCQSAELVPTLSSGFVRVFLDKNACAIVGTECPMTAVFAHEFSKQTFDHLLNGAGIGTALWEARRYFLSPQFRNPLGLAYTLYGRAGARLGQTPLTKQ